MIMRGNNYEIWLWSLFYHEELCNVLVHIWNGWYSCRQFLMQTDKTIMVISNFQYARMHTHMCTHVHTHTHTHTRTCTHAQTCGFLTANFCIGKNVWCSNIPLDDVWCVGSILLYNASSVWNWCVHYQRMVLVQELQKHPFHMKILDSEEKSFFILPSFFLYYFYVAINLLYIYILCMYDISLCY